MLISIKRGTCHLCDGTCTLFTIQRDVPSTNKIIREFHYDQFVHYFCSAMKGMYKPYSHPAASCESTCTVCTTTTPLIVLEWAWLIKAHDGVSVCEWRAWVRHTLRFLAMGVVPSSCTDLSQPVSWLRAREEPWGGVFQIENRMAARACDFACLRSVVDEVSPLSVVVSHRVAKFVQFAFLQV